MPRKRKAWPANITEAVDQLLATLPRKHLERLKHLPKDDLIREHFGLGMHIRNAFGLHSGNDRLLASIQGDDGYIHIHPDSASQRILEALHQRLNGPRSQ